jgi:hypothetical protein
VGPRAGLGAVTKKEERKKKKENRCLCRESISGRPSRSLVTVQNEIYLDFPVAYAVA